MGRDGGADSGFPVPIPLPPFLCPPLPLRFRGTTACLIAGFGGLVRAIVPDGSEWRRAAISP